MKKLILTLSLSFLAVATNVIFAEEPTKGDTTEVVDSLGQESLSADSAKVDSIAVDSVKEEPKEEKAETPIVEEDKEDGGIIRVIKQKIIEGGVEFMLIVVLCLIIGLTVAVERVITLNLATTNTKKLLNKLKEALFNGSLEEARELVANTRGPIAGIFAQGLLRLKNGESSSEIESSVVNHGSAEMSKLEKGLSWVNLFISLAPMFGFMGTVIGMIQAFDLIETTGEMEIGSVAGGIKVALLTTVAGLIVAIILQIFYNYCVSKIEDLSANMEESSNTFMDMISKYRKENNL